MSSRDETRLFDVRTLERNLRKGLISKKDFDRYTKGLPDAADKATQCNPEAQGREPPMPVHRAAAVVATPGPLDDDGDDLIDEDGAALLDDEEDDDEDDDEDEVDEVEGGDDK